MLVLARKKGEVVKLGKDITITVLEVRGDTVRIGIDAPRQLAVHRLEVFQEIERENRQAASVQLTLKDVMSLRPRN
jgi:carbon storage regulator